MPKISDAHREQRRLQILEAAWRCFQREGVQATRIEHILAESGLGASALYRYFKNKDDIILAAITHSMQGLLALLEPMTEQADVMMPAQFTVEVANTIRRFSARSGYNLMSIAMHGWSEAQRNEAVRTLLAGYYGRFRSRLDMMAARWQQRGLLRSDVASADVAQMLLSLVLGDVVQATIVGISDPQASARGLSALQPSEASLG